MKQGIDVSAHDGRIDWKKVKDSGVNFAILRAGYGNSITQKDEQFQRNYREATRVGIPVGAYWFSYATSVEDAKKEAKTCKEAIKGCRLSYPIFYDFEYDSVRYAAEQGVQVTKPLATAFAKAFLQEMERGGYYVGNYANVDYYQNYFDEKELKRYPLWLAEWDVEKPSIRAALWQYSERGKVDGIAGAVDKNRTNVDFPAIIRRKGKNGFPKETQKRTATVRPIRHPLGGGTHRLQEDTAGEKRHCGHFAARRPVGMEPGTVFRHRGLDAERVPERVGTERLPHGHLQGQRCECAEVPQPDGQGTDPTAKRRTLHGHQYFSKPMASHSQRQTGGLRLL